MNNILLPIAVALLGLAIYMQGTVVHDIENRLTIMEQKK